MAEQTRLLGSFLATDNSGLQYTLNVFEDLVQVRGFDGKPAETGRLKTIFTVDRQSVIWLRHGEYQLVGSGLQAALRGPVRTLAGRRFLLARDRGCL